MAGILSSVRSIATKLVAKIQRNPSSSSPAASMDLHNCMEDLRKLERTLQRIQAVLHDAEEREVRDESVKLWLRELKDVAYDAEDVLDEYHYEVLRAEVEARAAALEMANRKRKRVEEDQVCDSSTSFSELKVSIPDGMAEKIREIGMRFDDIAKDRDALHLRPGDGERVLDFSKYPPPTSSHIDESGVVGREDDREKIIRLVFSDPGCRFSVIPIVGMGGLGKTTLSQLVYNDTRVCKYFKLRGWVCVSVNFDVPRLARSIFESISNKSCRRTELNAIYNALVKKVKKRRVLLVLDDVWNENRSPWESLRVPFLSAKMVRIIVTTRNESVAKIMQTVPPYTLRGLPEEQCWLLFQRHAFGSENPSVERDLVEIGQKIVKKCAGLPLAVKALGGLLGGETDRERWKEVLESDIWELDQGQDEILPALRLSYQRLPACLKPCFVYCSLFPKDCNFEKGRMVRLWMAQGYIQPRGSKCLEDIGSDYFDELLRRSFFLRNHGNDFVMHNLMVDLSRSISRKVRRSLSVPNHGNDFVMHDLMVDLSRSISREECCTIRTVNDAGNMMCSVLNNTRHLYVGKGKAYQAVMEKLSSLQITTSLRTFLHEDPSGFLGGSMHGFRSGSFRYLRALSCVALKGLRGTISSMTHLRYLDINCSGSQVFPESICQLYNLQSLELQGCWEITELPPGIANLLNLRYLVISNGTRIRRLPESLFHLYNLQTLDLTSCHLVKELPSGIGELINLRHLFIPCGFRGTLGIEKLTNLQSLSGDTIGGEVEIRELGNVAILTSKQHTQKLSLTCRLWFKDYTNELEIHWYGGLRFPCQIGDPSFFNLASLRLLGCNITTTVILPPLAHLPALKSLSLIGIESICHIGREFYHGEALTEVCFPSLEELVFDNIPKWEEWDEVLGVEFPCLRRLTIRICSELRRLPTLPSLQFLDVYKCEKLSSIPLHQNPGHPSMLQELRIKDCCKLTSIMGLRNIASLENLYLEGCPKLQLLSDEWLHVGPEQVEIIGCPLLQDWSQRHNFSYFQEPPAIKELAISNSLEITSEPTEKLLFLESLYISNCSQKHLPTYEWIPSSLQYLELFRCNLLRSLHLHQNLSALETLDICSCSQLSSVVGLHHLTSLEHLIVSDCPEIQLSGDEWLPSTLQSLVVRNCGNLRSLPLLHQDLTALGELQIMNCCKLASVNGLNNLASLQTLLIRDCPALQLSPSEWLSSMPEHVYITCCPGLTEWCKGQQLPYEGENSADAASLAGSGHYEPLSAVSNAGNTSNHPMPRSARLLNLKSLYHSYFCQGG